MTGGALGSAALALARLAPAASGGGHGEDIDWALVASLFLNAFLFFGFLIWKAGPLVSRSLKNRRANMAAELEKAQRKQAEAEARLAEYQKKLDNLESEVARVIESYEKEANAERARIEQDTEKAIERLARETDFTINQEMKKAERLIREEAVNATLEAAEAKIKKRITGADQDRLTQQYVRSLAQGQNGRVS
jgi:F-type H+-transporting ATPase subunit b